MPSLRVRSVWWNIVWAVTLWVLSIPHSPALSAEMPRAEASQGDLGQHSTKFELILLDMEHGQRNKRLDAIAELGNTDAQDIPFLPRLGAQLRDPDPMIRLYTSWALTKHGRAAVETLANLLDDPDPVVKRRAARILGRVGPSASGTVPKLVKLLIEEDSDARYISAWALGKIGQPAESAVQSLVKALSDPVPGVRFQAAVALPQVGAKPELAVPAIAKLLADPVVEVRRYASDSLLQYGQDALQALNSLQTALNDADSVVAFNAISSLANIGSIAVPSLIESINRDNDDVRYRAALALGVIGPDARQAIPVLEKITEHPTVRVRQAAMEALERIIMP